MKRKFFTLYNFSFLSNHMNSNIFFYNISRYIIISYENINKFVIHLPVNFEVVVQEIPQPEGKVKRFPRYLPTAHATVCWKCNLTLKLKDNMHVRLRHRNQTKFTEWNLSLVRNGKEDNSDWTDVNTALLNSEEVKSLAASRQILISASVIINSFCLCGARINKKHQCTSPSIGQVWFLRRQIRRTCKFYSGRPSNSITYHKKGHIKRMFNPIQT